MKFSNKIKEFKRSGFNFTVNEDVETISINLSENDLFIRDYESRGLKQENRDIECYILTLSELIAKEAETIESYYYYEFEQTLKEKYDNVDLVVASLFNDSHVKAKALAKEQILSRYLTQFNCVTLGNCELIADKFYLVIQ